MGPTLVFSPLEAFTSGRRRVRVPRRQECALWSDVRAFICQILGAPPGQVPAICDDCDTPSETNTT